MKKFHFETRCVEAKGTDIEEMVQQARPVTYRTFFNYVSLYEVLSLFAGIYTKHGNRCQNCFPIKQDKAVHYFKSRYQNRKCYYLTQSGIEYVFTLEENRTADRFKKPIDSPKIYQGSHKVLEGGPHAKNDQHDHLGKGKCKSR